MKDAYTHPDFNALMLNEVQSVCTSQKLSSLEKPKKVFLTPEAFSIENNLLTPTMKLKRNLANKHFEAQFNAMYANSTD